ncbi:LEAF RUST 10 DISEASE-RESISTANCEUS RECEPTOR-LIKE PROTEIN KINASE-like 1.2 isoform X4 [Oryza sativa Japonica Group]|uniref:LEAF RUST 10 DISEASE-RESISTANCEUS RECEPTOR-LIKE PROTEIN KINASE-like 1.2 isoform X4 n=1 Tax=Oryza sativa subsp. japonica TaxID=39947 RepID=UPI000E1BABCA|nr:LEAF RUST 10 DISEASE-RESISTANCE LOCUS RECEPTOR-LIKE PROTEIN KINASE-like 1.2 isoform X4 [Oryza sativa Japonica Group]
MPPPLLLLPVVLALFAAADASPSACRNATCGDVPVAYPFWLIDNSSALGCGYPGLGLRCVDNTTLILPFRTHQYRVLDIEYGKHTISLTDADMQHSDTNNSCPHLHANLTIDDNSWLQLASSDSNITFLYNCKSNSSLLSSTSVVKLTGCGAGPEHIGSSYVFLDGWITGEAYDYECETVVVAPVIDAHKKAMVDAHGGLPPADGSFGDVLSAGFELTYSAHSDKCGKCERTKGWCGYRHNETSTTMDFTCFCDEGPTKSHCGSNLKTKIIAGVVGGGLSAVFALGLIATVFFVRKRKHKKVNSSSKLLKYSGSGGTPRSMGGDMESGSVKDLQTHLFSYEELEEATDSFNENRELGDGGFGTVYKGILRDGRVVAVKRLYNNSYRRVEQFVNEAAILSRLRHPNLVMFYGCTSSQSRELLLVYEFVANGTVADHLHGHRAQERALSWPLRLNIAVESAAALTYLHAIEPPIVHRDVKTTNILLDADFHVKVADFGLSRLFPLDVTHVSTAPQGTPGYVDPEYHQCYQLTDKSDVYSFGVVLVELISSKPAVDITRQRNEINLAGMAINRIQKSQLEELVDLELGYESDPATKKMMTMVAELAFRCLQQNGEMRPPIKEVLEGLKGVQDLCVMEKDGGKDKKGPDPPLSPDTVHAQWDSRQTTPNTSQ